MNLNEWFNKGITAQEYVDSMEQHQEGFVKIYEHFTVPAEDEPFFTKLQNKNLRAIAITEDWCGDAMLNLPIFLRMAEAGGIATHFLHRDENLELMDQYLTNGTSRSIPKIIIIDEQGEEWLNWGPRAPKLQEFIDGAVANLPPKDADDFKEKQQELFQFVTKAYRDNEDFHSFVYQNLKETLAQ
ncbi:thioredoxin family protein [Halobacillus amylolyticus]|uniref:Thioredoxin family protein n=1 Tax=Halobacillus amylolyticus TaxID=2932259 RepID=A0ABY4HBN1_9BACI|nr:thioredoxin family protein [Halobacillus amylolyticus]UOR11847.1 thioredoxin family protein [Halobacillus amylolyticus]